MQVCWSHYETSGHDKIDGHLSVRSIFVEAPERRYDLAGQYVPCGLLLMLVLMTSGGGPLYLLRALLRICKTVCVCNSLRMLSTTP